MGELFIYWNIVLFDQEFYLLFNLVVGGDWLENVNNLGIDVDVFVNGQEYVIDYVCVYECVFDLDIGCGCEIVCLGYESLDDVLVEGEVFIFFLFFFGVV